MKSVNFVFLGSGDVASTLGKRGTSTDLTIYDRKESDIIRTWVVPEGFPDKIQPLFQAVNLAEYAILHVETLDRFVGEQILALDMAGVASGILSHTHMVDHDSLLRAVRGTVVQDYHIAEPPHIREVAAGFEPIHSDGDPQVVIDHAFDVKGAGTIILGKVTSGAISRHDDMMLVPSGMHVNIKSIQMHDDPVYTAAAPARVGLALKGARPEDVNRGDVLCGMDAIPPTVTEVCNFTKSPFHSGEPSPNQMCLISVGLQIIPARFASTNPITIRLDRPAACTSDRYAILKPDAHGVRIMGGGAIPQQS